MASGSRVPADKGKNIATESHHSFDPREYADFQDDEINIFPDMERVPTQESFNHLGEISTTKKTEREFTSDIWNHFTKTERFDLGEKRYDIICKYCGKIYKYTGGQGYGTFKRHLRSKHPTETGIDIGQQQISGYVNPNSSPLFRFNDKTYKEELGKFISVEHLAFNFGERFGFNEFVQNACAPQAKRVPRNSVKRIIKDLYKKGKKDLQNFFMQFNGCVHIGSDIWSDPWQSHSYMGITCHLIDDEWNIQKRVIAFRVFDDNHTANNIYRLIRQILEEYYLLNKIFSIGFDNAAANTASIVELENICRPAFGGKFFHVRCVCHVLNLCVQDGLKTLDVFLQPIKMAIQFLWKHPQKMREWGKFCKENGRRPKRFPKDVPTRWNSTFHLLTESLAYKDLLCTFISNNVPQINLYPQEWDICQKILDVLKVFNDATYTLSGVYYPTTHLILVEFINIVGIFDECENDVQLQHTILAMKRKWLHYYMEIPIIYLVSSAFDPRCKIDGLHDFLRVYYQCLNCDDINVTPIVRNVKNVVIELYNEFYTKYNLDDTGSSQSTEMQNDGTGKISRGYQLLLHRQKKQKGVIGNISELESYLNVSFEITECGKDFLILDWWKGHASRYPILALIAKQIFSTPCSTVAVEQAFSAGGNILEEHRSRLDPESVQMQACVADWTKAQYRQQEIDRNAESEFFNDGGDTTTTGTGTGSDD